MPKLYRQISYGIDEIIQKCGADIHSTEDWETIFLLLKTAGAGLILEKTVENREIVGDGDNISCATSETDLSQSGISDTESESGNASDRGYTSDRDDQPTEILSLRRMSSLSYITGAGRTLSLKVRRRHVSSHDSHSIYGSL